MSMAIKYGLQKKAKGGCVGAECPGCRSCAPDDEPADKSAPVSGGYADGGLVERIMKKRHGETENVGEMPAEFDVMDQIEPEHDADYTGANSGDELGNAELDENDADLIRRIMRSRAKKDHNPRPA